ncbi:MAG: phosphatidylglycerophosphatase A [Acidobacteriia bacterium]|nr:phosphatidylglycerophosphatase A [Methyloceanibacter sp.]MBX5471280.1 phosphatidylglycerophosphatase A [Acetobacteraceae bacterium]MCL6491621.1 phosphatidylglycerophosphatase A [Terriglobia bacterium]
MAKLLASGFGLGFAPFAPGTLASLVALLLGAFLLWLSPFALPVGIVLAIGLGFAALRVLGPIGDPGYVVIDEIAGQFVALLPLARPAWPALIAAFLLFRLFDILKPPPLSWLDRYEHALGVMGDDLAAGVLAAAALWLLSLVWPNLFGGVLWFSQL